MGGKKSSKLQAIDSQINHWNTIQLYLGNY